MCVDFDGACPAGDDIVVLTQSSGSIGNGVLSAGAVIKCRFLVSPDVDAAMAPYATIAFNATVERTGKLLDSKEECYYSMCHNT
jgi:hypothetical protein